MRSVVAGAKLIRRPRRGLFLIRFIASILLIVAPAGAVGSDPGNLAARGLVGSGDDVLIGGLIVADAPVTVLLRARGPSIESSAIPGSGPLADPYLQLFDASGVIDSNDNWSSHASASLVPASLAPTSGLEAAMVVTLNPGAYTAIVSGVAGATGVGVVESFYLSGEGRLHNISTRALVGTGDAVLIGGFILTGPEPRTLTLRARGPSIDPGLVGGRQLADPVVQVYSGSSVLEVNDNWRDAPWADSVEAELQPRHDAEAVIVRTFTPGAYTLIVSGAGGSTGVGIVEVFAQGALAPAQTALEFYTSDVDGAVIQSLCTTCHKDGFVAGSTRLVYLGDDEAGHLEANFETLRSFVSADPDNAALLLSKATGVGHGGGPQIATGSDEYTALSTLVSLLEGEAERVAAQSAFGAATLAGPETTLRRAALTVARRLPTEAELASVRGGGVAALRQALRGLMDGPGFHAFLLDGANDRLHTDGFFFGLPFQLANLNNARLLPIGANRFRTDQPTNAAERAEKRYWTSAFRYGLARAPLELIAHVITNDLPYTEILTADYTMVNPTTSSILRSGLVFPDYENEGHFLPGQHRGQVLRDDQLHTTYEPGEGTRVLSHGPWVDYPHAGILNTQAFLNRYPTTETNRNRARARWTYYHFLGIDIERSAPRTTDPAALTDTNNPTMHNPACTVCHAELDTVAGAFQNYGNDGLYRDRQGGLDSLPPTYKFPRFYDDTADGSPYVRGDTWFRDMREPGFDGMQAPHADRSLAWLAEHITRDPRFATAAVRFWWPALIGARPVDAPEVASDPDYTERLATFIEQDATITALGQAFAAGIDGGHGFNARDLFVEMMLTPWFRADGGEIPVDAGTSRLLTPAELEAKTAALIGWAWGERPERFDLNGKRTALVDQYRIYYGGIDSNGILDRARELTALMANVAERQAISVACPAVALDFDAAPDSRRLFPAITASTTPDTAAGVTNLRDAIVRLHASLLGEALRPDDEEVDHTLAVLTAARDARLSGEHAGWLWGTGERCAFPQHLDIQPASLRPDASGMKYAWTSVLIYLMTDFRYLHE